MTQIQIQTRPWKQVATLTSTAPHGELTLRKKTLVSRPRSQRPGGKAAQRPFPQRINADRGHPQRPHHLSIRKQNHVDSCDGPGVLSTGAPILDRCFVLDRRRIPPEVAEVHLKCNPCSTRLHSQSSWAHRIALALRVSPELHTALE